MTTKSFKITEKLMQTLSAHGQWDDYVQSQLIVNGFDPNKSYGICDDLLGHQVIISQEVGNDETGED